VTRTRIMATVTAVAAIVGIGAAAGNPNWSTTLTGYGEVPAQSTTAGGSFSASISDDESTISWQLTYEVPGITQSHLHFGQPSVNGGISVFLCTNLGNGPAGTQACPANSGTISGIWSAADVVGPAGQGIAAGELSELIAAIRSGNVYANIHTTAVPAGFVRGQLAPGKGHGD
jgi:CHRD domain-containing protein